MAASLRRYKSDSARFRRLLLEKLEDRRVLATFGSNPKFFTEVGDTTFFVADDGEHGPALWKTDGTENGTVLVKDVDLRPEDGSFRQPISQLTNVSGTLFFGGDDGTEVALWKSDGTTSGTVLVDAVDANYLTNVNGTLFFNGYDAQHGRELWTSDGTADGTNFIKDVTPGVAGTSLQRAIAVGDTYYFVPSDRNRENIVLWKSDGTAAGTQLVKDLGSVNSYQFGLTELTNANGKLFVTATDDPGRGNLWTSNGTASGTKLLISFESSRIDNVTEVQGTYYFSYRASNFSFPAGQLWKTNGTAAGTSMVLAVDPTKESRIEAMANRSGQLLFLSDDLDAGKLWSSDGSAASTIPLRSLAQVPFGTDLVVADGTAYFTPGRINLVLWKSDGSVAGTQVVKEFSRRPPSPNDVPLAESGGAVFLSADDGINGFEPWKTMGTAASTVMVKDVNSISSTPGFVEIGPGNTYVEGNPPVPLLGPKARINNPFSFGGAVLQVSYKSGPSPNDRLSIRNEGTGLGQIGLSGTRVLFGGKVIGTMSGGGTQTLTVRTNFEVTNAAMNALIRAVVYENVNRNSLSSSVRDFLLHASISSRNYNVLRSVAIEGVNDPPALQGHGNVIYRLNDSPPPIRLLYEVQSRDPDGGNLAGGQLAVRFTAGAKSTDYLSLTGHYEFDGQNRLLRDQQVIGTRNPGGGKQGTDLIVTFNQSATAASVKGLLESLRFSTQTRGVRQLSYTLTDGDGGTSNTLTSTVTVPANSAPVLTVGEPVTNPPNPLNALFQGATVRDADSPNFSGGSLVLSYDINRSGDEIVLGAPFVLEPNNYLVLNRPLEGPLVIGRLMSSTLSSPKLEFKLNAQATAARVEWLLNSLRFNPDDISLPRKISATLTDGDGGTSNTIVRQFGE